MNQLVPAPAATLLDFIATLESRGGYNIIFGNHQDTLATPITGWTLDYLLQAQSHWASMWASSAAGRYQIMPQTLRSLFQPMNLAGSEIFSADFQDLCGLALLKRRGYDGYMSGSISLESFALQLAEEWASLPRLDTGKSYYDGDGLNHALATPAQFRAVLTAMKEASASTVPSAPIPVAPNTEPKTMPFGLPTIVQFLVMLLPGIPDDIALVEAELKELASTDDGKTKLKAALTFAQTLASKIESAIA